MYPKLFIYIIFCVATEPAARDERDCQINLSFVLIIKLLIHIIF